MKKMIVMVGLVMGSVLMAKADATFDVVLPAVPAVSAQAVQLKAVVTEVMCQYLQPAYSNSQYIVRFNVVKPDGSLLRMDAMRITQAQIAESGDAVAISAMSGLATKVNEMVSVYISSVSTNADWLAGKRVNLNTGKPNIKVLNKK